MNKYISEVTDKLPCGIIEKSHTGMGATHLELECERNSIIVEPLKVTAYNKVVGYNSKSINGKSALYVGSAIGVVKEIDDSDIIGYISNAEIAYKKIVCVADSFQRVYNLLGKENSTYFVLIDEIDSIQNDSVFRDRIETCIDIYKLHEPKKRAVLTATPIKYSDPFFLSEPKTIFNLNVEEYPVVYCILVDNPVDKLIEVILKQNKQTKIVIALNWFEGISKVINVLKKNGFEDNEIGILAGGFDNPLLKLYRKELDGKKYPSVINFITSAYYTGYDIDDNYSLFLVSDYKVRSTVLSSGQIKQIAGRSRNGFSKDVKFFFNRFDKKSPLNQRSENRGESLILKAEAIINSEKCLANNFKGFDNEFQILKRFKEILIKTLSEDNYNIVRKVGEKLAISYFKIDSIIELESKIYLTHSPNSSVWINLISENIGSVLNRSDSKPIEVELEVHPNEYIETKLDLLLNEFSENGFSEVTILLMEELKEFKNRVVNSIIEILFGYHSSCNSKILSQNIREAALSNGKLSHDSRELNSLKLKLEFISSSEHVLKPHLRVEFKIGENYTNAEIVEKLRRCYAYSGLSHKGISDVMMMKHANIFLILDRKKLIKKFAFSGLVESL